MQTRKSIARALASAFASGRLDIEELVERGSQVLGRRWRWLRPLAISVKQSQSTLTPPRKAKIETLILSDQAFIRAFMKHQIKVVNFDIQKPKMSPIAPGKQWDVCKLTSASDLVAFFGLPLRQIEWLADQKRFEFKQYEQKLRNYRYRVLAKRSGNFRLIEAPKPLLKSVQRQILAGVLNHVPPHKAAHGFLTQHSIATFAVPHVGRDVVIKLDLKDFFPSINAARVEAIFRCIGYPELIADTLAGICTNSAPLDVWNKTSFSDLQESQHLRFMYARPHLPQGAPTSPALANLSAYRLDCRLEGLANSAGATYTRYADDLAFSGDTQFRRSLNRFISRVCSIVIEEGFRVNNRKIRVMERGSQQRIAGLVVNQKINISRFEYDRLKATLTNCIRQGWNSQNHLGHANYRSHLAGRISFFEAINPAKGRKLRTLFDRIDW